MKSYTHLFSPRHCLQAELFNSFHNTAYSAEAVRYSHLKAGPEEPSTAEVGMSQAAANNIIQPTNHAEMIHEYFGTKGSVFPFYFVQLSLLLM